MESRPGTNPPQFPSPVPRRHPIGNKLGWILSGALVLALVAVIVIMNLRSSEESPTTLAIAKPGFFEVHEVKMSPAALLGGIEPSAPGNAADDYRQAIEVYRANSAAIADAMDKAQEIRKGTYTVPPGVMDSLQKIYAHVAAGAAKKEMSYSTPDMLIVRAAYEPANRLYWLAKDGPLDFLVNMYFTQNRFEEMEKVLRAEFVLGWHMANERVRAVMGSEGLDIMNRVVNTMQGLYSNWEPQKHGALLKAAEDYGREVNRIYKSHADKLSVVWKVTPEPGDVFAVVKRDKDRAWRIEGLLVCGVIRITHSTRGHAADVRQAEKLIAQYVNDPDPFVQAAAKSAAALTPEEFKRVGTPPGQ